MLQNCQEDLSADKVKALLSLFPCEAQGSCSLFLISLWRCGSSGLTPVSRKRREIDLSHVGVVADSHASVCL